MARPPSRWTDVVEAAGEEFRIRGYDSATLEDIAARVGILKGSIYNYVQNKEELLLAVVERPAHVLLADLEQLRDDGRQSATIRLRTLFRIQVRVFSEYYPPRHSCTYATSGAPICPTSSASSGRWTPGT